MKIRILDDAKLDLINGFNFYENQEVGVGQYFLDCLYSDIDSLSIYAGIHPKKFGTYYWMSSKRFPYAVYYTIDNSLISIHAIMDCRRDPQHLDRRLKDYL